MSSAAAILFLCSSRGPIIISFLVLPQNFHDSIAAIRGGVVGAAGYSEILVATQQGTSRRQRKEKGS